MPSSASSDSVDNSRRLAAHPEGRASHDAAQIVQRVTQPSDFLGRGFERRRHLRPPMRFRRVERIRIG